MVDLHAIARKWQKEWDAQHAFEADADGRPKFFVTFPYPYVNGFAHIGHTYSVMRVEAMARYQRMRGKNVLFPQAWHATGSPIDAAARRVRENEPTQIAILKKLGFPQKDISLFAKPEHWIKVFGNAWSADFRNFGLSIDWRRNFVTTDINPRYSKFIQWQFRKLKQKKLVQKGKHPVVWCPQEQAPVPDHSRSKGEGIGPEEMLLLKFVVQTEGGDLVLPAATFRPETVYGVTNMWLNPDEDYLDAQVGGERWLVARPCLAKLEDQQHTVLGSKIVKGRELIGKMAKNPVTGEEVPILPAAFVSPSFGTGVVMSVPAHAPYDYIALKDIQRDPKRFGVDVSVKGIKPISLIAVPGYKEFPALEECEKLGIRSQKDEKKLEEATNTVYKKEFHKGKLKAMFGSHKGKTIAEAKDALIQRFIAAQHAVRFLELAGEVVCRCLSPCHVKIVDNQWFLLYGDAAWKKRAHKALAECKLYPEKVRVQFSTVIDWLHDWACTREFGMGTKLPWDNKWIIESLSDSTIYMAYYTIAHMLKDVPLEKIDDALFDYAFLGKGDISNCKVDAALARQMRKEFLYWYPVDFRNSGKDLVQNHLAFFLFNHTAIFPEKHWPRGIGVNGYVNIQKAKMSKSAGTFRTLRDCLAEFSPDVVRMAVLATGEELADVDWDPDMAFTLRKRLEAWYAFAIENHRPAREGGMQAIDRWMESQLQAIVRDVSAAMDESLYRTAIKRGFFDVQRSLRWYLRRKAGKPHQGVLNRTIETQTLLLAPFTPHLCEALWEKFGKQGFVSFASWPVAEQSRINPELDAMEASIESLVEDVRTVLGLVKVKKPRAIILIAADDWKHALCTSLKKHMAQTRHVGELMKLVLTAKLKPHAKQVAQVVQRFVRDPSKMPQRNAHQEEEMAFLSDARDFLVKEFGVPVSVLAESEAKEHPKASNALPSKPAIIIE